MKEKGYSLRAIARTLGRSVSTISDELRRNAVRGGYDAAKAAQKASVRRRNSKYQGMKIVASTVLRARVESLLLDDQSPEAIVGRLRRESLPDVSKNSVYRFIKSVYGRKVESYRNKRKKRVQRYRPRVTLLTDRTFIDKRPAYINARRGVGHAEADFIVSGKSGKGSLLVVVDRKLRTSFLELILRPSVAAVHDAFVRIQRRYPELATITTDNDILFQKHGELAELLRVRIFFCRPYHSWEKGTVENVNSVIRRDIPKGADLSRYSKRFVCSLEAKLNRRILKCLRYQTPGEALTAVRKRNKRLRRKK